MAKMMNGRGMVILIGTSLTLQSYLMQSFQKFLTENFCRITCKRGKGTSVAGVLATTFLRF